MTSHAFLLQVHEDPVHLRRLVESLATPDVHFFVHVDKKSNLALFSTLAEMECVTFLEDRVDVKWGGWSQVEATLKLIRAALNSHHDFEYFTLLSGTHFPLRPVKKILEYYNISKNEYINIVEVPNRELNKDMRRFYAYYLEGAHRPKGRFQFMKSLAYRAISHLPLRSPGKSIPGWRLYAGSNWWTLSLQAIEHIMATIDRTPALVDFFRFVRCSDESFFQTILGNSLFINNCARADVFTDWSDPKEAPCHLRPEHLDIILKEGFLLKDGYGVGPANFARKLSSRNKYVVDLIAKHIASQSEDVRLVAVDKRNDG